MRDRWKLFSKLEGPFEEGLALQGGSDSLLFKQLALNLFRQASLFCQTAIDVDIAQVHIDVIDLEQ